ncbi:MAG: type II toxin-antitoxin system Phd/YefM family antitoxin [Desulfuromonadales bacterium]
MQTVTATDFSRNLRVMLNRVEFQHEELLIVRNNFPVARLLPGTATMTAAEAFADLYRTLPKEAGEHWLADSRIDDMMNGEVRNPWAS